MDAKLLTENRDDALVFESGVQRRNIEPDIELPKRVAINDATRELLLKDDSLTLLKKLTGRINSDSPAGGVLEALTATINISNNNLWRSKFSGSMTPIITSSNSFAGFKEGYILYENSSVTNATLNFTAYRKDFANTITLQTGEAFLLRYTALNGRLMLKEFALFEANVFPAGKLGALVITNGQTVTLPAGEVYDYSSINIQTGGTLLIDATLTPELTQIYCTGAFTLNGQIVGKRIGNGGTFSRITAVGEQVSFTVTQSLGGAGQAGNGSAGGTGANGFGGGGGGGAYSASGGNGGSGGASGGNGANGTRTIGGRAGAGNWSLGNGEVNRGVLLGGDRGADGGMGGGSGGGGGGGGSERNHSGDSRGGHSGSGGGYKGQHGIGLYLYIKGAVSGQGKIDLKGTNGYNGGANLFQSLNGYGGAGGGGAGGSGGTLHARSVGNAFFNNASTTLTAGKIFIDIGFGTGGVGGTRNYSAGGTAGAGSAGVTGTYNHQGIV